MVNYKYRPIINGFTDFLTYHKMTGTPIYFRNCHLVASLNINEDVYEKYDFDVTVKNEIEDAIMANMYMFDKKYVNDYYHVNYQTMGQHLYPTKWGHFEGYILNVK